MIRLRSIAAGLGVAALLGGGWFLRSQGYQAGYDARDLTALQDQAKLTAALDAARDRQTAALQEIETLTLAAARDIRAAEVARAAEIKDLINDLPHDDLDLCLSDDAIGVLNSVLPRQP